MLDGYSKHCTLPYRPVDLALNTMSLPCPRRGEAEKQPSNLSQIRILSTVPPCVCTHTHTNTRRVVRTTRKRVNAVDAAENDEQ